MDIVFVHVHIMCIHIVKSIQYRSHSFILKVHFLPTVSIQLCYCSNVKSPQFSSNFVQGFDLKCL